MNKEGFLSKFIEKFCVPTIKGITLNPAIYLEKGELLRNQEMVNWLKENLDKLE